MRLVEGGGLRVERPAPRPYLVVAIPREDIRVVLVQPLNDPVVPLVEPGVLPDPIG